MRKTRRPRARGRLNAPPLRFQLGLELLEDRLALSHVGFAPGPTGGDSGHVDSSSANYGSSSTDSSSANRGGISNGSGPGSTGQSDTGVSDHSNSGHVD